MPCSICKETGHTKNKCPTKVSVVEPEIATPTRIIIDDSDALWKSLSTQSFDPFQPFNELTDNAIAAIMDTSAVISGDIYINFSVETNIGSIEHSGGSTFPIDSAGISRCLTYGGKRPSTLNEHGCGLNTSLAILDPTNTNWELCIKTVNDGAPVIFKVSAPYKREMTLAVESSWPGQNKNIEPGSYIRFPINKERFIDLYTSKLAKMEDISNLHDRIKCHFSHEWMKHPDVCASRIRIHYNGEQIPPFSFNNPGVYEFVDSIEKKEFTLSTGGKIEIARIKIKQGTRKLPGSYKFKHAMSSTGALLFKNGRLIEFINGDDFDRKLYSRIFDCVPHNSHNGYVCLVNMVGTQEQLPATVSTKNRFQSTPLFDEFITNLHATIPPFTKPEHISEDSMVSDYKREREGTMAAMGIACSLEQEKVFTVDGESTPRMDLVCTRGDSIEVMEFKARSKVQLDDLSQLMANWMLAKAANPTKSVQPVLVLFGSEASALTSAHRQYLHIFKETCGFAPIIRTNKNIPLYPSL